MTVGEHIIKNALVKYRLHKLVHTFCHGSNIRRHSCEITRRQIGTVLVCDLSIHINVAIGYQIEFNGVRNLAVDLSGNAVNLNKLALKVFAGSCKRSVVEHVLDILLQVGYKVLVALVCDNGQHVDIVNNVAAALHVHTVAVAINTKTQTASNLLTLCRRTVGMTERTYLEHVGIVPAFTESRVREDKSCRLVEGKQTFLVFQNKIISRDIVRELASAFQLTVDASAGLFINTEISSVNGVLVKAHVGKISLIRCIQESAIFLQNGKILLFENLTVLAKNLVAVFIVLTVLCNLVDEEQRKRLDTLIKELFFFFKVRDNGFADLNTTHILLGYVAHYVVYVDGFAVGKGYTLVQRIDLGYRVALILLHFLRYVEKVIANAKNTRLTVNTLVVSDFKLNSCSRRMFRRYDNAFKIEVFIRTTEILNLKSLNLNFFYKSLIESVQSIQHVNKVVLRAMRCRIIDGEQRIEVFECLLRYVAPHFLRLVQDDNRSVCLDNVDRTTGCKLITLGIDDSRFLALAVLFERGCKRLRVDNHDVNTGARREAVELVEVCTVIDEESRLFAVVLHEVLRGDFKGLLYTLADSDGRNNYDKLAPTVTLVELKHGLDVNVGFTGTGFHFHVKRATTEIVHKLG